MEARSYIVRLDDQGNFFSRLSEGVVYGSVYPSCAVHMRYQIADQVCQRIRETGYDLAVVCDFRGQAIIAFDLEKPQPVSDAEIGYYWDDKITRESSELREEFEERKRNTG